MPWSIVRQVMRERVRLFLKMQNLNFSLEMADLSMLI